MWSGFGGDPLADQFEEAGGGGGRNDAAGLPALLGRLNDTPGAGGVTTSDGGEINVDAGQPRQGVSQTVIGPTHVHCRPVAAE